MAQQEIGFHAALSEFIFVHDSAYLFIQFCRNDLRVHIGDNFLAMFMYARILFIAQDIINAIADERSALVGNTFRRKVFEKVFHIYAFCIFGIHITDNFCLALIDDYFTPVKLVAVQ